MPILRHTPMLVGSGAERSIVHAIGQTFAHKARASGTVVGIDAKNHVVELKHSDGSKSFIDLSPRSIKNSGGGFYITSQLRPRDGLRVGQKFEKDDVLAYDPSYFAERSDGSVAYKAGLLVRTAIVALDQTFEDSLMVTDHLVQETAALVTMSRFVSLGPQANLQSTAKVGDVVDPNSALAVFENVTDDADISAMLQRVGREFDDAISELTKNVAAAKYAGEVIEIRTYYNRDPSELSESLRKFLERQEKLAAARSSAVKDAPVDEPIRVTAPQRITRDKVSGETVDGVLIQFLIRVRDVAAPGDKYVNKLALQRGNSLSKPF